MNCKKCFFERQLLCTLSMLIVVIGWNVKRMRWQEDENMRSEASQELVESVAASDVLAYRCSSDISQIYSTTIETDVPQI